MRIKTFTSETLSAAMALVRKELGEDAIILATEDESDGGVTVTAAIEPDVSAQKDRPSRKSARNLPRTLGAPIYGKPPSSWNHASGTRLDTKEREAPGTPDRNLHLIARVLGFHGLSQDHISLLLEQASGSQVKRPSEMLGTALSAFVTISALDFSKCREAIMLAGPPGAGKSSTAAKIAVAARLKAREVRFINLDTEKTGASQRLKSFAATLGADFQEADSPAALKARLQHDEALTIIDCPGFNPFKEEDMAVLSDLAKVSQAKLLQVMAAGGDREEASEGALAFAALGARHLIATRLDAARRLGAPLTALREGGLHLTALSDSAQISSGFAELSARALAYRLLAPTNAPGTTRSNREVA